MIDVFQDVIKLFTWNRDETGRIVGTYEVPGPSNHELLKAGAAALATHDELELTENCVPMIERDEGDVLTAYPDPGTGGAPWTIGYGHTGPDVYPGLVITQEQANALLLADLKKFQTGVEAALSGATTQNCQFSAMVSLSYNIGLGNFGGSSVLRLHKMGQYQQAADSFLLWDKAAGRVLPGLVRRRHQERELYLNMAVDP